MITSVSCVRNDEGIRENMKRIKWLLVLMIVGLLAACGKPSSNEESPKQAETEENEPENIENEEENENDESDNVAEAPKKEVNKEESNSKATGNAEAVTQNKEESQQPEQTVSVSKEELVEAVRGLEKVNDIIHNEGIYNDLPYANIKEQLTPYVTAHWIEETEPIYDASEIDMHTGFFPFRVNRNLDVWFDYKVDGTTAYVSTFSPGDEYAYLSYDLDFVLKQENDVWKVDQYDVTFDYGEEGKNFSIEEAKELLEKFYGYEDVTHVATYEEELDRNYQDFHMETVYEFDAIYPETGGAVTEKVVAYDGRTLMW